MMNGFFRITFTGIAGSGFGVLAFYLGKISGADVAGATYDGTYTEHPTAHEVSYQATMAVPAGVALVMTGVPLVTPAAIQVSGTFQQNDVESGRPVLLQTSLGPVNIIFSKIRDFP